MKLHWTSLERGVTIMCAAIAREKRRIPFDGPATRRRPSPLRPPGWYPDPSDSAKKRYWDGAFWHDLTTPVAGVPQLPLPPVGLPTRPADRSVFEIDPSQLRRPRWTVGRVASFVAVLLLGSVGWAAIVAGIAYLVTGGEANTLVLGYIGIAVSLMWAVLASMLFPLAPGRTWRLARIAWFPLLAVLAVVILDGIANMIVP
jgi:hypothetical protein